MAQYNRILAANTELYENGRYDDAARARENRADRIVSRYANNIINSRAFNRAQGNAAFDTPVSRAVYMRGALGGGK